MDATSATPNASQSDFGAYWDIPSKSAKPLAANFVVVNATLVCACAAVAARRAEAVDVAVGLLFGALVVNVAVLKFFRARTFQAPLAQAREGL